MNKVFTIGRDPSCDIVIVDNTDVVSRVHASLKVKGRGKYILVDQGRNGTYVNGIKMSTNEEIPVTRKDTISFAHVADLDWSQIPKERTRGALWVALAFIVVAVIGAVSFFLIKSDGDQPEKVSNESDAVVLPDSSVKNDTVKDTVFIRETPKAAPRKKTEPKKEAPKSETPVEEDVIDAIY